MAEDVAVVEHVGGVSGAVSPLIRPEYVGVIAGTVPPISTSGDEAVMVRTGTSTVTVPPT